MEISGVSGSLLDGNQQHHDAVFTEKPLQHLLTGGNMAIDKRFNCTILSKERDLIEYLKALNSPKV